ncbi:MAG TPA: hypothetical protein VMT43_07445 [Acidimicrobiales bacterium]|nr:hypothetical protein [Acidimicrobiales bacterium]
MASHTIINHPDGRGFTMSDPDGATTEARLDSTGNLTIRGVGVGVDGVVEAHGTVYAENGSLAHGRLVVRRRHT